MTKRKHPPENARGLMLALSTKVKRIEIGDDIVITLYKRDGGTTINAYAVMVDAPKDVNIRLVKETPND